MPTESEALAAEQYDAFIKTQWQDMFRHEVHVRLDSGARYVPNGGAQGVSLLRKNRNAFDEAIRLWSAPGGDPVGKTKGYDRIVEQAGIEYTWEWLLIDPARPWSAAVPEDIRERIRADLERRKAAATTRNAERAEEAERAAVAEDDAVLASMAARRTADGKPPLTEEQTESVRERRRAARAD
jgi:hypothetical protein